MGKGLRRSWWEGRNDCAVGCGVVDVMRAVGKGWLWYMSVCIPACGKQWWGSLWIFFVPRMSMNHESSDALERLRAR